MNLSTKVGAGFQEEADKYAAYLETAEGRLRLDLTVAAVEEFSASPALNEAIAGAGPWRRHRCGRSEPRASRR